MAMMSTVTEKTGAFGSMATIVPMPPTMKKPRWSIGILIDTFLEEVSAKGLPRCAAISAGLKGRRLLIPTLSREIETVFGFFPLPGTSSALMNRQ